MAYAIEFQGNAYTPEGKAPISDTVAYNLAEEAREIEWLKTAPDHVFLYVTNGEYPDVHTWLGQSVSTEVRIGPRAYSGFDRWTYRRAVRCRIFGVLYHGWYMESSGDYCRLRKAKRQ